MAKLAKKNYKSLRREDGQGSNIVHVRCTECVTRFDDGNKGRDQARRHTEQIGHTTEYERIASTLVEFCGTPLTEKRT